MNKSQLINKISKSTGVSKVTTGRVLNTFISSVLDALKTGDNVMLMGFGSFFVCERPIRSYRNPKTGKKIIIPPGKVPRFRAGKSLKDSVN